MGVIGNAVTASTRFPYNDFVKLTSLNQHGFISLEHWRQAKPRSLDVNDPYPIA